MPNYTPVSPEIDAKFKTFDWRNGLTIVQTVHPKEWNDVCELLTKFILKRSHLSAKGKGNKSEMAGMLDSELYRRGWVEKSFDTKIVVDGVERPTPTHSVDCFTGRIAIEIELSGVGTAGDRC